MVKRFGEVDGTSDVSHIDELQLDTFPDRIFLDLNMEETLGGHAHAGGVVVVDSGSIWHD